MPETDAPVLTTMQAETLDMTFTARDGSDDLMAAIFGVPVDMLRRPRPAQYAVTTEWIDCPFTAPRKRPWLTGKAYRIARRGYARNMRAWRRGQIAGIHRRMHLPRAVFAGVDSGIRGASVVFTILDEGSPSRG